MLRMNPRRAVALGIALVLTALALVGYAASFVYRDLNVRVIISPEEEMYVLQPPLYNLTCTGLSYAGELARRYVNFSEGVPGDLLMVNGSRSPRGLVGISGYWNNVTVHGFTGLRGFPITWQLREHKTYGAWSPDILFVPLTPEGIRLDSWSRNASSLGNAYLFAIIPVELVNSTRIRNRFNVYFSFDARTVGVIDIANGTVARFNDTYFATYNSAAPPWEYYRELYYRLYTVYIVGRGNHSFDIVNTTILPADYGPYVTYSYVLMDYWVGQTVHIDTLYILLSTLASETIVNFTYPIRRYTVVLERSGTVNDYGYLNFGIPGLTIAYFNTSLNVSNMLSTRLVSIAGAGAGGIALVDSQLRNFYFIGINNTNGALVIYRYIGASVTPLGAASIPGFTNRTVYNLTVHHVISPEGENRITAYVYSEVGELLASITVSDALVSPRYPGFAVQSWLNTFADFLFLDIRLESWFVRVQNVPLNYHVELYYDGSLVSRNKSIVDYGPVDLVVEYGRALAGNTLLIRYPNEMVCLNTTSILVYTGSIYNLATAPLVYNLTTRTFQAGIGYGYNTTSFMLVNITIPGDYGYYAYLALDPITPPSQDLALEVYLVNATGYTANPVIVVYGIVLSYRTSPSIVLRGGGNYVRVIARHVSPNASSQVVLNLALCSTPNESICQFTRLNVTLKS